MRSNDGQRRYCLPDEPSLRSGADQRIPSRHLINMQPRLPMTLHTSMIDVS